ncbi:gamma-aminobutyraldehyde dehydrogenase [Arthrobacter sp. S2(2024)]|uniref:gamma-aminobutyraldehyde dehydrogenase n=1 Tax=Arthrobacter sp. S2(2024) TaxID=3111911 RepID=UPI002FC8D301
MTNLEHQYVNGQPKRGGGKVHTLVNPATGLPIEEIAYATADDVDAAVQAAGKAFLSWSRLTPATRSEHLHALANQMSLKVPVFAALETKQTGKTIRMSTEFDVPGSLDNIRFFAGAARNRQGLAAGQYMDGTTSMTRREALGVIGSIAPWNYPLQMAVWKILPAIAAGNTIVLKPSELTPGTAWLLADCAAAAGLPDGVLNVVVGSGRETGEAIVNHKSVAMVSFTGSTAVGRHIMGMASQSAKRVHLELGGKAPFVVFDDADIEAAARGAVAASTINGGQDCTAATRAYVHDSVFDHFTGRVAELMDRMIVGDPTDPSTDMGSLISVNHRDRVAGFVDRARQTGATVLSGGYKPELEGAFYRPTLIVGAPQNSEAVQDEIFGPVLTALRFSNDTEAISLANDTEYGLAASAWTSDVDRAMRASDEIEAGCVWINDHIPLVSDMPHGGVKASGFGKDMSIYALEEYTSVKHVMINHDKRPSKAWHGTVFKENRPPSERQ